MQLLQRAKTYYIVLSVLAIALGLCLIIWPGISIYTLCVAAGALLVVGGVTEIITYFTRDPYGIPFGGGLAFGVFAAALGCILMFNTQNALVVLPIVIGVFITCDSVFKLQSAVELSRSGVQNWWIVLALAFLCGFCGILIAFNPFDGAIALTIALGISLVLDGIQNLYLVIDLSKKVKKIKHDDDPVYVEVHSTDEKH